MISIAVVGAGQIGSRHLQSLAQLDRPARIIVVEPSRTMRAVARERYEAVAGRPSEDIQYLDSLQAIGGDLDLAIVATAADVRRDVIEKLLQHVAVRYLLLEKVLFQRIADYAVVGELLERRDVSAWVNCSQRLWPFFLAARAEYPASGPLELMVKGSNWGLGCNAIHNLDFLSYLAGSEKISLSAELDEGVIEAKRPGFIEFTGTLVAEDALGNRVTQASLRSGERPLTMEIRSGEQRRVCDLTTVPRQSDLTYAIVQSLLTSGQCELPAYAQSAALHVAMLKVFLEHVGGDVCPIT